MVVEMDGIEPSSEIPLRRGKMRMMCRVGTPSNPVIPSRTTLAKPRLPVNRLLLVPSAGKLGGHGNAALATLTIQILKALALHEVGN